jgi:hypothetical protein
MEITSMIAHLVLIAVLFCKRVWVHLQWLALIAVLGLAFTILLHFACPRLPAEPYFVLYYAVFALLGVLYAGCIWQLWRTPLESIAFSQVLYLAMKIAVLFFLWRHLEEYRTKLTDFMRPLNIIFISLWALAVARYDERRKEPHMTEFVDNEPEQDPDGPTPPIRKPPPSETEDEE